tara:strand:+ start:240 stop:674 length:435 start_codon:yes stop_codon:yes gene_type:complete
MLYLYAILGIVMMSGIMSIFEMGLSLTGQSMMPTPPDAYLSDASMKGMDIKLLKNIADKSFLDSVSNEGLCGALDNIDVGDWSLISEGRWANSCQLNRGSQRVLVREELGNEQMPYQLFSCALSEKNVWYDKVLEIDRCSFERE